MRLTRALPYLVALGSLLTSGCVAATYEVQRAALVAPPAPPMWSGQTANHGFALSNASVVWKNPPRRDAESSSGLYVAGTEIDGTLHLRLGPSGKLALWLPFSYAPSEGSFAAAPCLVSRPRDGVFTGGVGIATWTEVAGPFYLGFSLETQLALIPTHVLATCVSNCDLADPGTDKIDIDVVPVLRWGVMGGFDLGVVRLFGGLQFRNHPSNVQIRHEVSIEPDLLQGEVEFGPIYLLAGLGVEVDLGSRVSLLAQAYQPIPLYQHDLIYGPILGISLDVHAIRIGS